MTIELCEQFKFVASKEDVHPAYQRFLSSQDLIRSMMGFIGKGSGNAQEVRDEILHIMHRNKIKEVKDHFYEEWHQKLHNNTTPEDVPICEALLLFLESNDIQDYWTHLAAHGIDAERLASYERPITREPYHDAKFIPDFQKYLKILKQMHSSDDLVMMADGVKNHVGNDTKELIQKVMDDFEDENVIGQMSNVLSLRQSLAPHLEDLEHT